MSVHFSLWISFPCDNPVVLRTIKQFIETRREFALFFRQAPGSRPWIQFQDLDRRKAARFSEEAAEFARDRVAVRGVDIEVSGSHVHIPRVRGL